MALKNIKIKEENHKELMEVGKKGESFGDIIHRLIVFYKKNKK